MSNNDNISDFFDRTITAAFVMASSVKPPKDLRYEAPREPVDETIPAFIRNGVSRKNKNDPWGQGWHGGFPPGAGA
jgi:hypothetical protein